MKTNKELIEITLDKNVVQKHRDVVTRIIQTFIDLAGRNIQPDTIFILKEWQVKKDGIQWINTKATFDPVEAHKWSLKGDKYSFDEMPVSKQQHEQPKQNKLDI